MNSAVPIIERKIHPPRLPKTFCTRRRLVDLVHRHIDRRLIVLSAGAGYGKTTLLADFCRDTDLPICWLTLDPYDARLATFVTYLIAAIRVHFPDFGADLELPAAYGDVELLGRLLISAMERLDSYFALVLDDYHEVNTSVAVNSLIDLLLSYLPDNCHLLLASRGMPTRLNLTRLAARQESFVLTAQELAFTRDELRELLVKLGHAEITDEQLDSLLERSEGWVTGVLLAAQVELNSSVQDITRLTGAGHAVFDYLAAEVLQQQPPAVQSFLLGSSLLEEMTPATCNALLSIANSAEMLASLVRQSLFTYPTAGGRSYSYHHLFRHFLRAQLSEEPDRFRELSLIAGDLVAAEGDWAAAIERYLEAEAYGRATTLLEMAAEEAFEQGQRGELSSWIDRLPDELLEEHPRLLFYRAKGLTELGDWGAAVEVLQRVQAIGTRTGDAYSTARALVQLAVVERLQLNPADAIEHCERVLRLAHGDDNWARMMALLNRGICRLMQADDRGLGDLFSALGIARTEGDETNAAYIAHDLGNALARAGRLREALASFHEALLHWRQLGMPSAMALTLQGLGVVNHHLGEYVEAETRLSESLAEAEESQDHRLQAYARANLAELFRDLGRYDDALAHAEQALALAGHASVHDLMVYLVGLQADIVRLQGDARRGRLLAREALDQARAENLRLEAALASTVMGMASLQQGDPIAAAALVEQALPDLRAVGAPRELARAYLQLSLIYLRAQDQERAMQPLEALQELVGTFESDEILVTEGPEALAELERARSAGLWSLDLTAARALSHRVSSKVDGDETQADLAFYALDGGQVLVSGQPVARWESSVAREMAFLLAANPRGLRRDTIIEALWPESEPDKGNNLFHSTLYRVRRALGGDAVVRVADRYGLHCDLSIFCDATLFEELAMRALEQPDDAESRRRALALYQEPYLSWCDLDWCYQQRERLRRLLRELLLVEADQQVASEDTHAAEAAFGRLLQMDDLDERAYRGLMWCRYARGDDAGAVRAYMQCRRALRRELGVDPELTTRQMWDRIRRHESLPRP
ncbi:MAG: tetratricopeptide repeat protein [Anaerolineae bacterium]|jgi:LuxR family maltose regulon positive regulatory protein